MNPVWSFIRQIPMEGQFTKYFSKLSKSSKIKKAKKNCHSQEETEVKVAQLCPALCNPMDYTVHGILQARILEWVAFPFSRGSSQPRDWTQVSRIAGGFFTSWVTREAPRKHQRSPNSGTHFRALTYLSWVIQHPLLWAAGEGNWGNKPFVG